VGRVRKKGGREEHAAAVCRPSPTIAGHGRRPPWPTPLWISPVGKEVGTGAEEKGWEMTEEEEMADGFEPDGARPHRRRLARRPWAAPADAGR
jgi:hypothetical protein